MKLNEGKISYYSSIQKAQKDLKVTITFFLKTPFCRREVEKLKAESEIKPLLFSKVDGT